MMRAALSGVAAALDHHRHRRRPPHVEEGEAQAGDGWLVLLDRDEPSRSLIVLPARLSR